MKKFKPVISWFLLGLYGLVLVHSFTVHHHTEDGGSQHIFAGDFHEHHHHHDASHDHDFLGLLTCLFDSLTHTDLGECHFKSYASLADSPTANLLKNTVIQQYLTEGVFYSSILHGANFTGLTVAEPPPIPIRQHYNLTDPLRGPPPLS